MLLHEYIFKSFSFFFGPIICCVRLRYVNSLPLMIWEVRTILLSPLSWSVLLADAKGERRHVLTDLCCLPPTDFTSSQSPISKGLVTPSSEQTYENLSPVDVVIFSFPSKDISYQKFWYVVSVTISTTCDKIWRSRRASQNTNQSKNTISF